MITLELNSYIHQQLDAGVSKDAITQALTAIGWGAPDIREAFAVIESSPLQRTAAPPSVAVVQTSVQDSAPRSHKGIWIAVIVVAVILIAGGAFAGYRYYLSPLLTPPAVSTFPTPPVTATATTPTPPPAAASTTVAVGIGTTSMPAIPPATPVAAPVSSTAPVSPPVASPSSAASLTAQLAASLPSATLTVNNAASATASASTFTLKWSSMNADTFSATRSVAGCFIPAMDMPDTVMKSIATAHGTNMTFVFTKNDLALLSGCTVTVTYTASNTTSAQQAQAAVTITFPSTATTTAALINMTSLRP